MTDSSSSCCAMMLDMLLDVLAWSRGARCAKAEFLSDDARCAFQRHSALQLCSVRQGHGGGCCLRARGAPSHMPAVSAVSWFQFLGVESQVGDMSGGTRISSPTRTPLSFRFRHGLFIFQHSHGPLDPHERNDANSTGAWPRAKAGWRVKNCLSICKCYCNRLRRRMQVLVRIHVATGHEDAKSLFLKPEFFRCINRIEYNR
jgi:hypothetical protein